MGEADGAGKVTADTLVLLVVVAIIVVVLALGAYVAIHGGRS